MKKFKVILCMMFCITAVYVQLVHADDAIKISNAWVRMMPPSERTSAAYMEIENKTDQAIVLESASSEGVDVIEMHQMSHENGMMKMGMVHDLIVPAKGKFLFDEHRYHLMLINIKESLKKGAIIPMVLHFKGGLNVTVNAVVQEGQE